MPSSKTIRKTAFTVVGFLELPESWSRFGPRVRRLPFMPYLDLLRFASTIDITIAPLVVGNDFCEAKSELKIFEVAAVGVPTVAAATRSYSMGSMMVSPDLNAVSNYCDRALLLEGGLPRELGLVQDVISSYETRTGPHPLVSQ